VAEIKDFVQGYLLSYRPKPLNPRTLQKLIHSLIHWFISVDPCDKRPPAAVQFRYDDFHLFTVLLWHVIVMTTTTRTTMIICSQQLSLLS